MLTRLKVYNYNFSYSKRMYEWFDLILLVALRNSVILILFQNLFHSGTDSKDSKR